MIEFGEVVDEVTLPAQDSRLTGRVLTIPDLVQAQAARTPDATAVSLGSERMSYAELADTAARLAGRLRSLGVRQDDAVGLCLARSPAMVQSALGVMQAGAAYLPLDPAHPTPRLLATLEDAEARVVVTDATHWSRFDGSLLTVVLVEDLAGSDSDTVGSYSDALDDHPPGDVMGKPSLDDLAYVIYTSGSTGRPKGVEITHRSLLNLVRWHQEAFSVTVADRATAIVGPGFDAAVWELWPYLTLGASVTISDDETRLSAEALRQWLVAERVTICFLPTVLAEALLSHEWPDDTAIRILLTGADVLHTYPRPSLPFTLVNNYGPAECTVVATSGAIPPSAGTFALPSIGRPITNVQIHLLGEDRRPVVRGDFGEIYVGGEGVARGYRNDPELTAERFVPDPWETSAERRLYRTGDLARYRDDGTLEFGGRIDAQVQIRGNRVEPEEVALSLNLHPDVAASCVVASDGSAGQTRLVAYFVTNSSGRVPAGTELTTFLRGRLPNYMVPAGFVRLSSLPMTPNGKVDRVAVLAGSAVEEQSRVVDEPADEAGEASYLAPRTPAEQRIALLAGELLKAEKISVDDDFFLLGGHSLLATQLIVRIRDEFGVEIPLRTVFEHPTVRELAGVVEDVSRG